LSIGTQARAEWRVLMSAALIGSGVGLGLGAGYMAGGMGQAAIDHSRAARIAEAAEGGFSDAVLQHQAAGGDQGVLRLAREHDPSAAQGAMGDAERDRQAAVLAANLDRKQAANEVLKTQLQAVGAKPGTALDASRELDCLTSAVYFEARGETPVGQAAVAQVVLNRVKHPAFPKTVCGVVFQGAARHTGCQFSFACDGSMHARRESGAWARARKVAARALSGVVLADIGSATHYHTIAVSPAWGPQMRRVAQVGLHVFYRFNPRGYMTAKATTTAPNATEHAVLTSLQAAPDAPPADLRLASAMVAKPDVASAPAVDPKPAKAPDASAMGKDTAAETVKTTAS
jgi:spore germination cell wall hydrolase CwlJ-like protein